MADGRGKIPEKYKVVKIAASCRPQKKRKRKKRRCLFCNKLFRPSDRERYCPKCRSVLDSRAAREVRHKFHGSSHDLDTLD